VRRDGYPRYHSRPMMKRVFLSVPLALLAATIFTIPAASAQQLDQFPRPSTQASVINDAPTIDGNVLNDPAWSGIEPTSGFIQQNPDPGQPASQRTEVFLASTADTLYIGVVCYDSEPERIIVADSRRDSSLEETDSFQIILDTYRDELTGFVFGTNPAGIQYDGQVTREGEGGAFSAL